MDGHGAMKYADGSSYEGNFKASLFYGQGTLKYANGDVYEGTLKASKKDGQGTIKYVNGRIEHHTYKNNKLLTVNGKDVVHLEKLLMLKKLFN